MKAFPMLNTLRFAAATGVLIQHAEEIKHHADLTNIYHLNGIKVLGGICVSAFFVLSGFLITFLLLHEKKNNNTIQIKSFYIRRILRIWPLYFMTIFLYKVILIHLPIESKDLIFTNSNFAFGVLNPIVEISPVAEWFFLLLLLPQVLLALGKVFYPLHVWSIGVEEAFYLFWPWVLLKCHQYRRTFLLILLGYLLLYFLSFSIWIYLLKTGHPAAKYFQGSTFFLYCQRISCMAIGAIGAEALFFNRNKWLDVIRHPLTSIAVPVMLILLLYKGFFFPVFVTEVYCILFIALILQVIYRGEKVVSNPIYKLTEELGKISFGLYMYHPFCIVLTVEIFSLSGIQDIGWWQFYSLCCFITFGISYLSFHYIESPILQLKSYFETSRVPVHSS